MLTPLAVTGNSSKCNIEKSFLAVVSMVVLKSVASNNINSESCTPLMTEHLLGSKAAGAAGPVDRAPTRAVTMTYFQELSTSNRRTDTLPINAEPI